MDRPSLGGRKVRGRGDELVTRNEVDFIDDTGETWLVRNRTTLKRVGE